MEPLSILYANNLDLLFENRNKLYGAYPLRKYYAHRLYAAMGTVLGLVLIFSGLVLFFRTGNQQPNAVFPPDVILTQVLLPPLPIAEPVMHKPAAPAKPIATAQFTKPLMVQDIAAAKPMATTAELNLAAIGVHAEDGPADNGPVRQSGSSGTAGVEKSDSTEGAPVILDRAEYMPEFPGGPEALRRYLLRNLRMPESALEPGSQVRVVARFVVGPDGKVRDINLITPGGKTFDEEVTRVISRMPVWKPGIQHQKKVSVYYSLPVSFVVPAEN